MMDYTDPYTRGGVEDYVFPDERIPLEGPPIPQEPEAPMVSAPASPSPVGDAIDRSQVQNLPDTGQNQPVTPGQFGAPRGGGGFGPQPTFVTQETPSGQAIGTPAPPAATVGKTLPSRMAQYGGDRPLDALAKLHAQYVGGTKMTDPMKIAAEGRKLIAPLAQVLGKNGAGADAMLNDVARLAWFKQTGGKEGAPEHAPQSYIDSWKGAYKAGQPVILSRDLDTQLQENRVSPAAVRESLKRPEAPRPNTYRPGQTSVNIPTTLPLTQYAQEAAKQLGINPTIATRLIAQESGGNQAAVSPVGARGITQLMPATARYLEQKYKINTSTPQGNIIGGMLYLKEQLDRYKGNYSLALAAYNAGPGAVDKYGGIPPFEETQRYVRSILGR